MVKGNRGGIAVAPLEGKYGTLMMKDIDKFYGSSPKRAIMDAISDLS